MNIYAPKGTSSGETFTNFADFIASDTTHDAGTTIVIQSIPAIYTATDGTGNLGQTNAGGQQWDVWSITDSVEAWGATGDGTTDDSAAINKAIEVASLSTGSRKVRFGGNTYGISSAIIYKTGVHLIGAGKQGTRIKALVSMVKMIKAEDATGATTYYRFGMRGIWLDGDSKVTNGVELRALRNGYFEEVYTSGFTGNGWDIRNTCYYNTFWACEDNSPGRGWLFYEDGASATGSNENHFYSCRKNVGTDGWYIQSISANLNSIKLVNCMVEAHSGNAVYIAASSGQFVDACIISGLRVDSVEAGAGSVNIASVGVRNAHLQDIYVQSVSSVSNSGDGTKFSGYPFVKSAYETIDFASIPAQGQATQTISVGGINSTGWRANANPSGGGSFPDGLILEARVSTTDTVKLIAHNKTSVATDPVSQSYLIEARRVR